MLQWISVNPSRQRRKVKKLSRAASNCDGVSCPGRS
jgi:hypothetical protein